MWWRRSVVLELGWPPRIYTLPGSVRDVMARLRQMARDAHAERDMLRQRAATVLPMGETQRTWRGGYKAKATQQ